MGSRKPTLSSLAFLCILAFAVTTNAQLDDLPDLGTVTGVFGATTTTSRTTRTTTTTSASSSLSSATQTIDTANVPHISNAPTLYGVLPPPLIVPDTSNAPFMQRSNLPEGFVFICVAATLGFLALSVLLWRGLVAWSLQRSVKRAAADRFVSEKKSLFGGPGYSDYTSVNVSLDDLPAKDSAYHGVGLSGQQRHSKTTGKPQKRQTHQPSPSSLFFSPTAGAQQTTKSSGYLPAGYYASGSSTLGAGSTLASLGGPAMSGYAHVDDGPPSPPPHGRVSREERRSRHDVPSRESRRASNMRQSEKAPSSVLDDLFDSHTGR